MKEDAGGACMIIEEDGDDGEEHATHPHLRTLSWARAG